ncbi:MAG: glycosyltransferase family 4 protein [Candidatus Korobacteraceae bacterium]
MDKKITVLHTIETAGPGGAETVVLQLATLLNPERFRSLVVLPERRWLGAELEARGVPTFYVPSKAWYDLQTPMGLVRTIRDKHVDVVHSHLPYQNFDACLAGALTGRKTIVTYHGPVELEHAGTWPSRIRLATVRRRADSVVVVCDFVGQMLVNLGFDAGKIVRIYNGIHVNGAGNSVRGKFRRELGIDPSIRLVGMIANVRKSKGYEFYVRAAAKVLERYPNAVFVGAGDIDEQLGAPIRKLMSDLALGDRFRLLGFRSDVRQILEDLDLTVLASTSEGMPLVTIEAMAASKPLVVTRCGGPPEVVEHGTTGLTVPPGDADALAEAILSMLQRDDTAEMGRRARAKVEREFSIEKMIASYEELYTRTVEAA